MGAVQLLQVIIILQFGLRRVAAFNGNFKAETTMNNNPIQLNAFQFPDFSETINSVSKTVSQLTSESFPGDYEKTLISTFKDISISASSELEKLQNILNSMYLENSLSPISKFSEIFSSFLYDLSKTANLAAADTRTIPAATAIVFLMVVAGFGQDDSRIGTPFPAGSSTYDVKKSEAFYGSRPLFVLRRLARLARITSVFNIKLLLDWRLGNLEKNENDRAKEALELVTQLGPTFIKLGQALSIRTDLIPKAYALELRQLQDAVPAFSTIVAKEIIKQEWGIRSFDEVFSKISDKPVASASIGQVYRATLKDGTDVAIKVQRPNILGAIALDLYLLRLLTPFQVWVSNAANKRSTTQADIDVSLALVDEWGRGFVAEVDYRLEAANTKQFQEAMISRKLDAVTAPNVVDRLSGDKVIVTEWMEGTRLDVDASPDIPRLCGVAVNAYLTMLLDTGVLHCDPHPGNLLRTRDGRLCILDWGMTLEVPKDLQYSLLEFIAHINTEDFASIPTDFVNLGFSPPDKLDRLKRSGITEGLTFAFRQLGQGGGPSKIRDRVKEEFKARYGSDLTDEELRAKAREEMVERMQQQLREEGVDVNGVTEVMEEMSRRNRELFRLPPYVLYVSRAFSTLEGIGLSVNPDYSILQECYPYLSSRLMTDNSPRAKAALRSMLLGTGPVLSIDKLKEMTDGFSSYTAATASADFEGSGRRQAELALAKLIMSPEGNFVQDILVEGVVKTTDAAVRNTVHQATTSAPARAVMNLAKMPRDFVHSVLPMNLRRFATPLTLPYEVLNAITELSRPEPEDTAALARIDSINTLTSVLKADNPSYISTATNNDNTSFRGGLVRNPQVAAVVRDLTNPQSRLRTVLSDREFRDGAPKAAINVSRKLFSLLLTRAAERTERSVVGLSNEDLTGALMKNVGSTASSVARRLASVIVDTDKPSVTEST